MSNTREDPAHRGYHALTDAERLLEQAAVDPGDGQSAKAAAAAALRALLLQEMQEPRSQEPSALLAQAAETDHTLGAVRADAEALEHPTHDGRDFEHAQAVLDAVRGRLAPD